MYICKCTVTVSSVIFIAFHDEINTDVYFKTVCQNLTYLYNSARDMGGIIQDYKVPAIMTDVVGYPVKFDLKVYATRVSRKTAKDRNTIHKCVSTGSVYKKLGTIAVYTDHSQLYNTLLTADNQSQHSPESLHCKRTHLK